MRDFKWLEEDERRDAMLAEMQAQHRWTRNIAPPARGRRYDPDEPPFDRGLESGEEDDSAGVWCAGSDGPAANCA